MWAVSHGKGLDLGVGARLLRAEFVARETKNLKTAAAKLLILGAQLSVVEFCQASSACKVHEEHDLALVLLQRHFCAINVLHSVVVYGARRRSAITAAE